jgi:hypothetical protein
MREAVEVVVDEFGGDKDLVIVRPRATLHAANFISDPNEGEGLN